MVELLCKKNHQQVPLDAKRKVMKYQVCTSTHTATGWDQKAVGMIQPAPGPEKVKGSLQKASQKAPKIAA